MKRYNAAKRGCLLCTGAILLVAVLPWILAAQNPSPELIVDICTTPNKYWNKFVMIKGHVRDVIANPPGTSRGSYVLRDSSDADITVLTTELPAMGKDYTVTGTVEQVTPDEKVPVLREFRRVSGDEPLPRSAETPRRVTPEAPAPPIRKRQAAAPQSEPELPAPVQPAPTRAAAPETSATETVPVGVSLGISTPLLAGLIGLAALIVIAVVIVAMRMKSTPAPARSTVYVPPLPTVAPAPIRPPAPPPPTAARTAAATPRAAATQVVAPPAPKATEVFFDYGAELSVSDGPDRGKRFNITKPSVTIGRSGGRQNDITLGDSTVSREHARIVYSTTEKAFRLINESTTNPARLNGNPVDTALVKDGDAIQLGATVIKFGKRS